LIYFDNAATTFPKPERVYSEMQKCMREYCGNPGRGSHRMSLVASSKIYECRERIARFFSAPSPDNAVFTMNTTYALNIAIKSTVSRGDHVLISSVEHNSVYRPIRALTDRGVISFDIFDAFAQDITAEINRKLKQNTRLLICTHSSNICGKSMPIAEIGAFLKKKNIKFIVDGAQSAGHTDINVQKMNIDILCVPGHKGLYGPQGCAALIFGNSDIGKTVFEGGGGINSLDEHMPDFLPERFEAGTLPTPNIVGLSEGIRFVQTQGINSIHEKEEFLCRECAVRLHDMKKVKLYSDSGIILFNIREKSPVEVCEILDKNGICVRGGFHCSPLAHRAIGTGEDGAVRVSFSFFNERSELMKFCSVLNSVI